MSGAQDTGSMNDVPGWSLTDDGLLRPLLWLSEKISFSAIKLAGSEDPYIIPSFWSLENPNYMSCTKWPKRFGPVSMKFLLPLQRTRRHCIAISEQSQSLRTCLKMVAVYW